MTEDAQKQLDEALKSLAALVEIYVRYKTIELAMHMPGTNTVEVAIINAEAIYHYMTKDRS